MKLSAPTMTTTATSHATKSGVCVGRVPSEAGTSFFAASDPASASVGTASQYRPATIATAPRML